MGEMQLRDFLRLENYDAATGYLRGMQPTAAARELCALKTLAEKVTALRYMVSETDSPAPPIVAAMPEEQRLELLAELSDNELAKLLNDSLNCGVASALTPYIDRMEIKDVAELFSRLDEEKVATALHLCNAERRSLIFSELDPELYRCIAARITMDEQAGIFKKLTENDDQTAAEDLLRSMETGDIVRLIEHLESVEDRLVALKLLTLSQRADVYARLKVEVHDELYHELDRDELWEILDELLKSGSNGYAAVQNEFKEMPPFDIAEFVMQLEDVQQLPLVFKLMSKDVAAEVFTYLDQPSRRKLGDALGNGKVADWIREMATDDAVDFLQELPSNIVSTILKEVPREDREVINEFLSYPKSSAGSLMTPEFIALREEMRCSEALHVIREQGNDSEMIYTCYVLDGSRKLLGFVTLRKILCSPPETQIGDIMSGRQKTVAVETLDDQEMVAARFKEYDLMAVPVVDREDRLVGIITADDIMDVMVAEQTEDVETMAGIKPSQGTGYLDAGIFRLARNRIGWLLVLMIGATFTGIIINRCEELLSHFASLAAFLPLLMDTCGNSGSQSSTLIVRGIAVGEVDVGDWLKVVWREMRVGTICAAVLAVVNFARIALLDACGWQHSSWQVNIVVNLTLFVTVIIAKLIGGSLPLLARLMRADPALMASPALTTCVDTVTLILYFACAKVLLPMLGAA